MVVAVAAGLSLVDASPLLPGTGATKTMTTYFPITVSCARCGAESEHDELGSVFSSGYPDLDGRRPGRIRATMFAWLQECLNCLFVARDLSVATAEEADLVKEIGFIEAGLCEGMPDLAIRFMRRAYIDARTGQTKNAIWRLLHAAWVLDDLGLDASTPRKQAADLALSLRDRADVEVRLLRLDLLRRTRAFTETIAEANQLLKEQLEANNRNVVVAQRRAAFEKRSGAISFSEAARPSARQRVHVITFPR